MLRWLERLAKGIYDLWQAATEGRGRLLVVERSYSFPARHGAEPGLIEPLTGPNDDFSYVRDAVGDAVEKVLKGGRDVAFVADGVLKNLVITPRSILCLMNS